MLSRADKPALGFSYLSHCFSAAQPSRAHPPARTRGCAAGKDLGAAAERRRGLLPFLSLSLFCISRLELDELLRQQPIWDETSQQEPAG